MPMNNLPDGFVPGLGDHGYSFPRMAALSAVYDLENTAVATDMLTLTLYDTQLRVGDRIEVEAWGFVEDQNATDNFTLQILVGTEVVCTTGAVTVADNDLAYIKAVVHVTAVGSSGAITWGALDVLDASGTAILPTRGSASEDLSGSTTVAVRGTWSAAHVDNEFLLNSATIQYWPVAS